MNTILLKIRRRYPYCIMLCFCVFCFFVSSCKKDIDESVEPVEEDVIDVNITPVVKTIMDKTDVVIEFKSDTTFAIGNGLIQTHLHYLNKDGNPVRMFILEADLKEANLTVKAISPYNDLLNATQKVSEMCRDNETEDEKIMAAINGDYFNSSGLPEGYFYIDGIALRTTRTAASVSFFAMYKSGDPIIGGKDPVSGGEKPVDLSNVQDLVSGRQWLVNDGELAPYTDFSVSARTAIGYTSNKLVYAIVVDAGNKEYSNGCGLEDLGKIFKALNAQRAINLSGGASSSFVVRQGNENKWAAQNVPSNDGKEGLVANGIAFISIE